MIVSHNIGTRQFENGAAFKTTIFESDLSIELYVVLDTEERKVRKVIRVVLSFSCSFVLLFNIFSNFICVESCYCK